MFDNNSQTNFVFVNFDEYDEVIRLYNIIISSFISIESNRIISTFFIDFYIVPQTNSLSFEIIDLNKSYFMANVYIAETFYEKESDPNKRAHIEKSEKNDLMQPADPFQRQQKKLSKLKSQSVPASQQFQPSSQSQIDMNPDPDFQPQQAPISLLKQSPLF